MTEQSKHPRTDAVLEAVVPRGSELHWGDHKAKWIAAEMAKLEDELATEKALFKSAEEKHMARIKELEQDKRLDAKWLDPECHNGCQSLVLKKQLTELSAAVVKKDEALIITKSAMLNHAGWKLNFAHDGKELPMTRHKDVQEAELMASQALSLTPSDALEKYLEETVELLERFNRWFNDDGTEGEFKKLIVKELTRLTRREG